MVSQESLLVTLVKLVERLPGQAQASKRGPVHPMAYPDRLFLKALVIMIVRHLHKVNVLLSVFAQPTTEIVTLRALLYEQCSIPSHHTRERRMSAIPQSLLAQIGCLGRHLVELIQPCACAGRIMVLESTILGARGGVRHQKHRKQGEIPHSAIETEAHWIKSGWQGWVYGWKLHVVSLVAAVWSSLALMLTQANIVVSELAPDLLREVPTEVRFAIGDLHYDTPQPTPKLMWKSHVYLDTTFHKLHSITLENFHELILGIFDGHGQVSTKGLIASHRFALVAMLCLSTGLTVRFEYDLEQCVALKAILKAA